MSESPLFSVVIPTYNRADLLVETLDSVLRQPFGDYEVVVVDDGSADGTPGVLARHSAAADARVRAFRQENAGQSVARNVGIRHAAGRYVAFLDSDDLWFPWTLEALARAVRESEPAAIATVSHKFHDPGELQSVGAAPYAAETFDDMLAYFESGRTACFGAGFLVVRTDVLREAGGFPVTRNNSEDVDLCLRIGTAGRFVWMTAPVAFGQRAHGGNVSSDVSRGVQGLREIVAHERRGAYPGGRERRRGRRALITFMTRALSVQSLDSGRADLAWDLYRRTVGWNLSLGRVKYLAGFPAMAVRRKLRGSDGNVAGVAEQRGATP